MRAFGFTSSLALLLVAAPALAWVFETPINTRVNGHEFHKLRVEAGECTVALRLHFIAPESGYQAGAKNRNYYRFRARIRFDNGKRLETPTFSNDAPGRRAVGFRLDTGSDGCWSKEKLRVKDVDIEGCRGRGCTIQGFVGALPDEHRHALR